MADQPAYLRLLQKLLPPGFAFNREGNTTLAALLNAFADEFARVDTRVDTLLREADPRQASELLPDWERITGLPDACLGEISTVEARRRAVAQRLGNIGGQTVAYFVGLAAQAGFTVTITEFNPFQAGSDAGAPLTNNDWRHTFRVNAPAESVQYFKAGSRSGEPLATWGNDALECAIDRTKPAHTVVQYAYGS